MTQSKKFALTGGIGSGKSAVSAILEKWGYPVFSCDKIYSELTSEPEYLERLSELFPGCVRGGVMDRKAVAERVFHDEEALSALNALAHPLIMRRLLARMEPFPLSFAEVPLLFESGQSELFDGVLVVMRERSARVLSVKQRDGLSEEEISARMKNQYDYSALPPNCLVIKNDKSLSDLEDEVRRVLNKII